MSLEGLQLVAGLHVPDLDSVLLAPRRQPPAVWTESEVQTLPGDQCLEGAAGVLLLVQARRVPQLDLSVTARGSQVAAVAAEHYPPDRPIVGAGRAHFLAGPRVPDLHFSVPSACDHVLAIGAEGDGEVLLRRGREREVFPTALWVPNFDRKPPIVIAGEGDPLAVGPPGHAEDDTPVARELDAA